ncbi:uncharacterized protein C11orf95 homolog isoform X1 [Oryzias latipes]|uniref:uncharacterized protein C11orf95 homolog isoform X1 n=1 Tax=Oryzias latipes TaxID=8090 RepID=UPI000CE21876|nr:uncharacterized protein C11orf95 homolog isoform X1 [Oryzias latipes]
MEAREPVDLRRSQQSELLSVIIGGEEEATREESDLGGDGHGEEERRACAVTPVKSASTSYWTLTEGPDQPLLLSPAPGPPARKPRVQRASRPGLSRIPGRDHRRYYHEYWRSEYLMDFDAQRHGMICMVCGSSLATLKLSTIKRHIRQKHPDSLLWSAADKEVIRSGWESHLSLGGAQRSYASGAETPLMEEEEEEEEMKETLQLSQGTAADPADRATPPEKHGEACSLSPHSVEGGNLQDPEEEEQEAAGPSAQTLERYLNDSLHAWFRQEFLMEYEAEAGRLLCMVCGAELPSLHLDHIKSHVLDTHPVSLLYSSEEKHCVLQAWAHAHEESENSVKSEHNTKGKTMDVCAESLKTTQTDSDVPPQGVGTSTQDICLIGEDGGVGAPLQEPPPKRRRLQVGNPWRLRLDYLVAYGPQGQGTFCMVCSQVLRETKVSSFRQHIQEHHPETTALSRQEREAMAAAWTKDSSEDPSPADKIPPGGGSALSNAAPTAEPPPRDVRARTKRRKEGSASGGKGKWKDAGSSGLAPRHGHYPGKDQRRNYQMRWRMEYLMDYDCKRHGLICMVCGANLATLKVSTIKRHIQQVHAHSLYYSAEEKQQAELRYTQSGLHLDEHFTSQEHQDPDGAPFST